MWSSAEIPTYTPDKRLDQIEPIVADVLQKVDRLTEGQGKLVEIVVDTKAELEEVKETVGELKTTVTRIEETLVNVIANGESTARAVANLTVTSQKQFDELKAGQDLILQILRDKLP